MYGATIFPQQIGLGAANDPDGTTRSAARRRRDVRDRHPLELRARASRTEDIRWGRTYETYSQDTARVTALGAAYLMGLQASAWPTPTSVLATAKHFVGDGSTVCGSSPQNIGYPTCLDQGDTPVDEALLRDTLLPPYRPRSTPGR